MTYSSKPIHPRICPPALRQPDARPCPGSRSLPRKNRKKNLRKRAVRRLFLFSAGIIVSLTLLFPAMRHFFSDTDSPREQSDFNAEFNGNTKNTSLASADRLPAEMKQLLERNPEAADFVDSYWDRDSYRNCTIDLTENFVSGQVPLLMQWDKRWGYNDYGDSCIGLAGCGPVCLNMAYLYFTEDTDMTPREMAEFAYDSGYYTSAGTSWSLWTEGTEKLGLKGSELPLDENRMCRALDAGSLIICSMGPGDFTTTGHFILIRGYDENGFYVNDPNRKSNSDKQWDFASLQHQIRNLWELSA